MSYEGYQQNVRYRDEHEARSDIIEQMAHEVREVNEANGWYEGAAPSVGDLCALLHSEVSEAFDAWRKHGFEDVTTLPLEYDNPGVSAADSKPEGYASELADVLIRLLDQADRHGVDLVAEYERKLQFNRTREYRHGGRRV